ncbi:hypothetical protein E4656_13750 [Natronospirillum operosum]|uniref:Uncharacterized protein n=1 Tax=Natronospirillum operosum TaxID=2759953 RepID=A0A4Z0W915_9GAMM|nr:hypothetical protein [Natronospirillum operosum]TGG92528.1 hypothetical protein E4656_13750 [Natronospirillum operosum]
MPGDLYSFEPVQDAILAAAKAALPGLVMCEPYAGQFGQDGPSRGRMATPGFFLAALDAPPATEQPGEGRIAFEVRWAAYCLSRNAGGAADRGRDAMALATQWAVQVQDAQWGMAPQVEQAAIEGVQNLYSAELDNKGFGLWAVTWRQVINLGGSIWAGDDVTPTEVWIGQDGEAFPDDYDEQDT